MQRTGVRPSPVTPANYAYSMRECIDEPKNHCSKLPLLWDTGVSECNGDVTPSVVIDTRGSLMIATGSLVFALLQHTIQQMIVAKKPIVKADFNSIARCPTPVTRPDHRDRQREHKSGEEAAFAKNQRSASSRCFRGIDQTMQIVENHTPIQRTTSPIEHIVACARTSSPGRQSSDRASKSDDATRAAVTPTIVDTDRFQIVTQTSHTRRQVHRKSVKATSVPARLMKTDGMRRPEFPTGCCTLPSYRRAQSTDKKRPAHEEGSAPQQRSRARMFCSRN